MERNYSIDFVKFFAIFFVVTIHTKPFSNTNILGTNDLYIDFTLNTFARFAVPFFFLIAGYLFGQKVKQSDKKFNYFKKYILKLIKLYIYWQLFYLLYDLLLKSLVSIVKGLNIKSELLNYISSLNYVKLLYYGEGTSGSHLWYLISLIWCVLVLFLFYKMNKINHLLILSLILYLIGLFGQSYSGIFNLSIQTRDAIFFGLFYTTFGFFFAYRADSLLVLIKWKPITYGYLFFAFSFLQIIERALLVKFFKGNLGDYFLSTILLTISLFFLVLSNSQIGKNSSIVKIGENSVGIYVIHVFFINITNLSIGLLNIEFMTKTIVWQLLGTPMVTLVSYIAYNQIQFIKHFLLLDKNQSKISRNSYFHGRHR
ncbi:acyltransferase family protein [Paenibacillus sp. LMG 31456]|uniref:Acyltransferase family protein n=1 Tax=Paenibacillus foliorum TaxID=2654974 RepID=A0A972GWJ0_9BACL|nr:acyltransferase [Paenibacillus foliorum]NOU95117.1 acyltransferase family protein [Paenibacillus foliorum]